MSERSALQAEILNTKGKFNGHTIKTKTQRKMCDICDSIL